MEVIPVIDLMGGEVVHARRGERDRYRPIRSGLTTLSEPVAVAQALLGLYPFRTMYVADLDAIRGRGDNGAALEAIRTRFLSLALWVDAGAGDAAALRAQAEAGRGVPVLGSEAVRDVLEVEDLLRSDAVVLSLDHDARGPLGPEVLHRDEALWPRRVIVMTLARVGADAGPDWDRLSVVLARAGGRKVYAAGGVRGVEDLEWLHGMGVAGALVASALHDGRLTATMLRGFDPQARG